MSTHHCDDDVTGMGARILGTEPGCDGECHRARYRWAARRIASGAAVLDFGCGTGYGAAILRDVASVVVVGVETNLAARIYARERYGIDVAVEIPTAARFDVITAFEVLEHLAAPPADTIGLLLEHAPRVIGSVPYQEVYGRNRHHIHAALGEATFGEFSARYAYQDASGLISDEQPEHTQNLLFDIAQ